MKKTRLIWAAILACAALFTGCRKDLKEALNTNGSIMPVPLPPHEQNNVPANRGIVHYHFQTLPQNSSNPMQWADGAMNAVQLLFNGTLVAEPAPSPFSTDSLIHQTVGLGTLVDLGFLRPRVGLFRDIVFKVKMGVQGTTNAIVLVGTYNAGGTLYPVRLIVDQDVFLQGQWPAETKILPPADHEHTALLQMDLDKLTTGANADLLKDAVNNTPPGTEIVISSQYNTQLYQHMYQNLLAADGLLVRFQ